MIILERNMPNGLHRIEIQENNNLVEYVRYVNNKLNSSAKSTDLVNNIVKEFKDEGYIEVSSPGTLKEDSSVNNSVKLLTLKEFRNEYPKIKLSDYPWDIGVIEVHTDDVVINGDLDLHEDGDYKIAEITHLVFLKNLTVNGSIYSEDIDTDRALRVIGDLTAHNLIMAGSQIYLEGKTHLKNALLITSDVDFEIDNIYSPLYIIDYLHNYTGIKQANFDYCLYFSYDIADEANDLLEEGEILDQEAEVAEFDVYFKGKKKVWVNNSDVLSIPEIQEFIIDKKILSRIKKMIEDSQIN